jgi:hypothetical protein
VNEPVDDRSDCPIGYLPRATARARVACALRPRSGRWRT